MYIYCRTHVLELVDSILPTRRIMSYTARPPSVRSPFGPAARRGPRKEVILQRRVRASCYRCTRGVGDGRSIAFVCGDADE